ncbi:hypothetical protein ASG35_28440 [Burkholderia sp. Leaf177]|nr:hypothetical protein ASG35_28440 [Burkholderia sp. Leaf177]
MVFAAQAEHLARVSNRSGVFVVRDAVSLPSAWPKGASRGFSLSYHTEIDPQMNSAFVSLHAYCVAFGIATKTRRLY